MKGVSALDLDELKGYNNETFSRSRAATRDDGELSCHFGLPGQLFKSRSPKIIGGTELMLRGSKRGRARLREHVQFCGTLRCFE
jgi:hypothetical protein